MQATEVADNSLDTGEIIDNSLFAEDLAPDSARYRRSSPIMLSQAPTCVDDSLSTNDFIGAEVNGAISLSNIPNGRCNQVTPTRSGAQVGQVPRARAEEVAGVYFSLNARMRSLYAPLSRA